MSGAWSSNARVESRTAATCAMACMLLLAPYAARAMTVEEQRERLLFESQQMEDGIARQGLLYGDAPLDAYLQSVTDRMFPEWRGKLRIHAIRDPEMNAFALPSGAIYVNTGALLRIRNEAELAALLGHEVTHVTEEHSLKAASSNKAVAGAAMVLSAGLTAVLGFDPMLEDLASVSTMAGFSRDREREADKLGRQRMIQAGYDAHAPAEFFERVHRELTVRKLEKGFYPFASHPRFESRVDAALVPTDQPSSGDLRRDEYLAATSRVRLAVLEELLAQRKATALTFLLGEEGMVDEIVPEGNFLLAEGYRLRGEPGDIERAVEQCQLSIASAPGYAPAWGALGRYYAKTGDAAQALADLDRFLELAPDSREAPFARQAVSKLRGDAAPPASGQ